MHNNGLRSEIELLSFGRLPPVLWSRRASLSELHEAAGQSRRIVRADGIGHPLCKMACVRFALRYCIGTAGSAAVLNDFLAKECLIAARDEPTIIYTNAHRQIKGRKRTFSQSEDKRRVPTSLGPLATRTHDARKRRLPGIVVTQNRRANLQIGISADHASIISNDIDLRLPVLLTLRV